MSVTFFKEAIINKIYDSGVNEVAIVFNSSYVTSNGKLVYIGVDNDAKRDTNNLKITCYYKEKDQDDHWRKHDVTQQILTRLYNDAVCPNFYEFIAPTDQMSVEDCVIKVDPTLGFLIIESALYTLGRQLMGEMDSVSYSTNLHGVHFDNATLRDLKNIFRREAYTLYQNIVYNKIQNRIIQKIYKRNSFYNIQKTFIPVFINVKNIYSPFHDDVSSDGYKNTKLYKMAIEKDRQLDIGNITCYMLTHLEICEAFGLSRFMRFTPDFVYKVFVGLLHPEYIDFPNKFTKVFIAPDIETLPNGLKRKYTEAEYSNIVLEYGKKMDKFAADSDSAELKEIQSVIKVLQAYNEIDSLRAACIQNRKALTTIGPNILDTGITERVLYTIIAEAHI